MRTERYKHGVVARQKTLPRRDIVRLLGAGAVSIPAAQLGVLARSAAGTPTPATVASSPNFVLILLDDVRPDDIDAMASVRSLLVERGATFDSFFVPTPLCGPSRASLMRGQYAHNTGVLRNTGEDAGFAAFHNSGIEQETIATLLQDAGYETALIGKYLNGYVSEENPDVTVPQTFVPPGWDTWVAGTGHAAYANYDYTLNVNGSIVAFGSDDDDYLTDVLSGFAVEFVDRAAASDGPFCLFLSPYAPHSPATPAPRHAGTLGGMTMLRGPAFNELDIEDKPEWIRSSRPLNDRKIAKIEEDYQHRLESLQAVDEMVAAVLAALEAHALMDSTFILLLSDNGYFLGEYRQPNGKGAPHDPATRVPFILRGPGIEAGSRIDSIVSIADVFPTFAALAGVSPPSFVDGRSLTPLFNETGPAWRQTTLLEGFGKESESGEVPESEAPPFKALRSRETLYVEYETGERELYDLASDPYQLENLANSVAPASLVVLADRLARLGGCTGSTCRAAEDFPVPKFSGA